MAMNLASCEKIVDFDIEQTERHVVVNAFPMCDSLLFVNLTYSRFFLDNQTFLPVDNATVSIDVNGTTFTSASRNGANYLFNYTAAANDSVSLRVSVPGHDVIVGGTRIPDFPQMLPPVAEIDTLQPITQGNIIFTINDPDAENYYYVYIMQRDSGSRWNQWESKWDTIDTVRHAYFNCLNHEVTAPEVNSIEGLMDYFNALLFTDANINAQNYELTLSLMMLKDTAQNPIMHEYTLVVESMSREAFRYTKEVLASQGLASYFAEPAQIYSNLSSGLGIFAGIARREYPLTFTYKEQEEE